MDPEAPASSAARRRAGILLHPTSLPGRHGIGDLGASAERFLDWAAAAGFSIWQLLPLGPTGYGNSPYSALSVFAGNPLLVSPDRLAAGGLLPRSALDVIPGFSEERVRFEDARAWKERLLRRAWEAALRGETAAARAAREEAAVWAAAPERAKRVGDWSLYAALKERHGGRPWHAWDPPLAQREPVALASAAAALASEREYHAYVEWLFRRDWSAVHAAARARGIAVLGDIPIYPAMDSAEVWVRRDLFQLGPDGRPEAVAGVPPDYFSKTGQLWGNPLYRWDRCEEEGYAWWIDRVRGALETCDILRLDHFRGFALYWSVPAGAKTAIEGSWKQGPGMRLFDALRRALGPLPLVAEDLGQMDPSTIELLRDTGLPGMYVLQFGVLDPESEHAPSRQVEDAVVYTGTHDNDTTRGWYESLSKKDRAVALATLGVPEADFTPAMIRVAMRSPCHTAVVPMQDVLDLGTEARMNHPAVPDGNWAWRARSDAITAERARELRQLIEASKRA